MLSKLVPIIIDDLNLMRKNIHHAGSSLVIKLPKDAAVRLG